MSSTDKRPLLIAHRGHSSICPENTMTAFTSALLMDNVAGVECDVARSSDGVYFILHDDTLERTTRVQTKDHPPIKECSTKKTDTLTWDIIKQFEVGVPGERCPLLSELLVTVRNHRKMLVIELKIDNPLADKEAYVAGLIDQHKDLLTDIENDWDPRSHIIFITFDLEVMKMLKDQLPGHTCVFLLHFMEKGALAEEVNTFEKVKVILNELQSAGIDGLETDLFAHENYPELIPELKSRHMKSGVYVSAPDPKDSNDIATGDRSATEHQWMIDQELYLFTSNLPTDLIADHQLWPSLK